MGQRVRLSTLLGLAFVSGCMNDPANPGAIGLSVLGKASFGYVRGGSTSTYSATGIISLATFATDRYTTTFALGFRDTTSTATAIVSNVPRSSGVSDVLTINVNSQGVGTFAIGSSCTAGAANCTGVIFVVDLNANTGAFTAACTLSSGVVTIATYSQTSATGSFSGSGLCAGATGVSTDFSITNGVFDVPVLKGGPTTARGPSSVP